MSFYYSSPEDVQVGEIESDEWYSGLSTIAGKALGGIGGAVGGFLATGGNPMGAMAGASAGQEFGAYFGDMFEPDPIPIMQEVQEQPQYVELMQGSQISPSYTEQYGVQNLYGFGS